MATPPQTQVRQYNVDINPSGGRHLAGGSGFIKVVDTSSTGVLDFGDVDTTNGSNISSTRMVVFRVSDFGDASGVFNAKVFLTNINAWGAGTYRFLRRTEKHFASGIALTAADDDVPTVQANAFNLLPTSGTNYTQTNDDGVSEYLYLAVLVDTDVPVGTYGGPGLGSWRYRIVYDYS